jgi:hypothetical protein
VVDLPPWKMMEFVNGKDDIPYMKWKVIKFHGSKPPISQYIYISLYPYHAYIPYISIILSHDVQYIYIVYYQGFGDKNSAFKRYWSTGDGTWIGTPSQKNSVVDLNRTYGQSFFLQLNYRTITDA